jgi:hypothetical protein
MANVKQQSRPVRKEIEALVARHLDGRKRRIEIAPDRDFDGADITRIEVDIDADETHDVSRLADLRMDFAEFSKGRDDLISPQLTFRANMAAKLSGKDGLGEDPEVVEIKRLIESLAP